MLLIYALQFRRTREKHSPFFHHPCWLQAVATKALGVPLVYVEAVDQEGNRVVEKVESEVRHAALQFLEESHKGLVAVSTRTIIKAFPVGTHFALQRA